MRQRTPMLMSSLPIQVQGSFQPVKARAQLSQTSDVYSTKLGVRRPESRTPIVEECSIIIIILYYNKFIYIYFFYRLQSFSAKFYYYFLSLSDSMII